MIRFFFVCFFIILFGAPHILKAENATPRDTSQTGLIDRSIELAEEVLKLLSYEAKSYTVAVYPMLGYSDRTGFEAGITPVVRFNSRRNMNDGFHRPSTVAPSFMVSTKGMYEADIDVMLFTRHNWCINTKAQFLFLPDRFYGLGNGDKQLHNASFDSYEYKLSGEFLKGINDRFFAGFQLDANHHDFKNINNPESNPSAHLDWHVAGHNGGWTNGIGPVLKFDSRNDILYPTRGWFVSGSYILYGKHLAGDFNFRNMTLDIRRFMPLKGSDQVLAFQAFLTGTQGDVPFYKMAAVGGKRLLRGIGHPYKYLGNYSWLTQAEYRRNLFWRVGGALFIGAGNVSNRMDKTAIENIHAMMGAGFRFRALPNEKLNIRLDVAMTNRGDHAIFFTIREAF